ncbi:AbrB family transcriptional regulator [Leptolyngbyaceae cyanobacterium CCMR0082]|uniref:AbrB family transcriptional regulator n=1 Tax=Adonisia turfae CCMR0082 TaxID=2304604 RepID=A0A6M0S9N4_9CYAN|nr:AbrB family transcriptional regulator [Adonisia turfae]NEZ65130.1 AbrB family transcriptional regulator [Adonisia turfae CCMR0082]
MQKHQTVVSLGPDGRLLIPSILRQSCDLTESDLLMITVDDVTHKISLEKLDDHIAAAEGLFQDFAVDNNSIVDELITERRQEASKEADPKAAQE